MDKAILYLTDRQRECEINGYHEKVQQYTCGKCNTHFIIDDEVVVNYCPSCGVKFDDWDDVSS